MNPIITESLELLSPEEAIQEVLKALEEANEELKYLFENEVLSWNDYLLNLNNYSRLVATIIETIRREDNVKVNGTQSNVNGDLLPYFSEIH